MTDCLIVEDDGPVRILTLNRPDAHNAISPELIVRLDKACEEAKDDPSVRAVVIASSGTKTFCAGGDLKLMIPLVTGARKAEDDFDRVTIDLMKASDRPFPIQGDIGKPLIAAIEGAALGGGLELVLACDMIVAGRDARFGAPEATVGAYPARITFMLPQRLPYSIAAKMLLSGALLDASDAEKYGLVSDLVDVGQAQSVAVKVAHRIASNAPISVQSARQVARAAIGTDRNDLAELDQKMTGRVYRSEDAREGPRAFAERRKPEFKGK